MACSPSLFQARLAADSSPNAFATAKQAIAVVEEVREDLHVLRDCLLASSVVSEQKLAASLHRRRFLRMVNAFSGWDCVLGAALEDLSPAPLTHVAAFLGQPTGLHFRCVCSAVQSGCLKASAMFSPRCFVWGGFNGERNLESGECLDLATGTWTRLPPMAERRSGAAFATVAGKLYVAGGFDGCKNKSSAARFDLGTHEWENLPAMTTGRFACSGAEYGGSFCVCGGNSGVSRLDTVECFIPEVERWESLPSMTIARIGPVSLALHGKLYVCGGQDLSSVECFDQGRWSRVPPMKHKRFGAAGAVCSGCIYIAGGKGKGKPNLALAERYCPTAGCWEEIAAMSIKRFGSSATSAQGRLYVFGGMEEGWLTPGGLRLAEGECYDPVSGEWEVLPPQWEGRSGAFVASAFVQESP